MAITALWKAFLHQYGGQPDTDTDTDTCIIFPAQEPAPQADAALYPLPHLGMLRYTGTDSTRFLGNMLSNDPIRLDSGAQWSTFCTPKGRMLSNLLLLRDHEDYFSILSADLTSTVHNQLNRFILRSKTSIENSSESFLLLGLSAASLPDFIARAGLPCPPDGSSPACTQQGEIRLITLTPQHAVLIVNADHIETAMQQLTQAGATLRDSSEWQLAMIRAGIPRLTLPVQDLFIPQMLNMDLLGGLRNGRGCYPGQEIITRMSSRGQVKQRLHHIGWKGKRYAAGTGLYSPAFGDQSCGKLVNIAQADSEQMEALAVLQLHAVTHGDIHLEHPDGPFCQILQLPYAPQTADSL